MRLLFFKCHCKTCDIFFKSPGPLGGDNDEFLLLDDHGDIVALSSFKNPVYDEVTKIFRSLITEKENKSTDLYLKLFSPVLSATCDLSPNNQVYRVRKPPCPICHRSNFSFFAPTNPAELVEMNIPNATHNNWNKLSDFEKKELVKKTMEKAFFEDDVD